MLVTNHRLFYFWIERSNTKNLQRCSRWNQKNHREREVQGLWTRHLSLKKVSRNGRCHQKQRFDGPGKESQQHLCRRQTERFDAAHVPYQTKAHWFTVSVYKTENRKVWEIPVEPGMVVGNQGGILQLLYWISSCLLVNKVFRKLYGIHTAVTIYMDLTTSD